MKLKKLSAVIMGTGLMALVIWGCSKKASTSSGSAPPSSYTLTINAFAGGSIAISSGTGSNIPNDTGGAVDNIVGFSTTTAATVTFTETPSSGNTFAGWGGACSGTLATCTLTMSANETVSASFNSLPHGSQAFTSPGNFTFTVPAGVTSITVQVWGGGGAGGSFGYVGNCGTGGYEAFPCSSGSPGGSGGGLTFPHFLGQGELVIFEVNII